jgi:hypothetical protein
MAEKKVDWSKKGRELTPEAKVAKFLKDKELTPLHFRYAGMNEIKDRGDMTELVEKILDLTDARGSYDERENQTTGSGKWRTVTDIWRHVKYFRPKRTIFAVMRALFELELNKDEDEVKLVGQICKDIHQRTFKLKTHTSFRIDLLNREDPDEFKLLWADWENIGQHYTYKKWTELISKENTDAKPAKN